ncbi:MAG: type VI secretion system protein TssA [Spirochaetaceae bacterium]|jgi:type VI secretion system protein ImpA|nr:type VI secretion system protein TssA [Spirochaetaceae bacterium]
MTIEELAVPLEGENPAGENLEYDTLYLELDTLAVPVPESQMGDSKIEGHEPDWKKLKDNCLELWKRTRDLRVAVYIVVAETAVGGLKECRDALKIVEFLMRDMWETLYPRLDPDDGNDPTERLNILAMLSPDPGSFNDPIMFIAKFRLLRLIPALPYTLRDYLISINELESPSGQNIDANLITGEFMRIPLEEIREQASVAEDIKETIAAICACANEKMGDAGTLSMASLSAEVNRLCKFFAGYLESFGAEDASSNTEAFAGAGPELAQMAGGGGAFNLSSFRASSRADALLLLRKGAEYFQLQEPNSPIPLLIKRAMRFSEMNFIDLIEDIVPDALSRGKEVLGIKDDSNS